jgi:hypothetical protein
MTDVPNDPMWQVVQLGRAWQVAHRATLARAASPWAIAKSSDR